MNRDRSHGRRGEGGGWRGGRGHRNFSGGDVDEGEGGGNRPPPGLKGREIGMWYARRGKARKEQQEKMNRPTVAMDRHKENNIRSLLKNIEDADNVPPQMFRDFDDNFDEDDDGWWDKNSSTRGASAAPSSSKIADNWDDLTDDAEMMDKPDKKLPSRDLSSTSLSEMTDNPDRKKQSSDPLGAQSMQGHSDYSESKFKSQDFSSVSFKSVDNFYRPQTSTHRQSGASTSQSSSQFPSSSSIQRTKSPLSNIQRTPSSQSFPHTPSTGALSVEDDSGVEGGDDLEEVPQVKALLEYSRAHGDIIYLDEELGEEFSSEMEETDSGSDSLLDRQLNEQAEERLSNQQFLKMLDFRKKLPSYKMREELVQLIRDNQVLVVSGETGCGKTTQVPQFVLDDYIAKRAGSQCHIICTQPRRISAVSVAERVASERCEKCGGDNSSVGYQIRLEVRQPRRHGSMLFCTTGIVLKFLEGDPMLKRATHVIIDEIHERDLQSDFLMIILKDLLPRRPDLKVILMSATLNSEMFSKYFDKCPMINIPGFTYPVQEYLLEDVLEITKYRPDPSKARKPRPKFPGRGRENREKEQEEEWNYSAWLRNMEGKYSRSTIDVLRDFDYSKIDLDLIVALIQYIIREKEDGAILVFVPGWEEISNLHKLLQRNPSFTSDRYRVIPLHSLMPTVNQREVFDRPPLGVRKIIIATNIAETSITIDDVVFVIDGGKIKVKDYDPERNLTCLESHWVSRANSKQRRGRAGRVQPGYCYHLYTGLKWHEMIDYLPPEMLRTRLEELCLQIKLLKLGLIEPFVSKAMQPPSMEALHKAIVTLQELNALDTDENLLPLGYHLARMPVEPHTGKMILFGAMFCCLDPILTVAASLSFKDAFVIPLGKESEADAARKTMSEGSRSDHIVLINALKGWELSLSRGTDKQFCWDHFLSASTLRMLRDMKKQLAELLYDLGFLASRNAKDSQSNINSGNEGLVKAVLCAGLYPHVAKVAKTPRPGDPPYKMVSLHIKKGSGKIMVHPKSVNCHETEFPSKWLVYYHMLKTTQVYVHDCTMVSPYPLLFFGGNISILQDSDQDCISVDNWIVFKASPSTAQLVKDLRKQLDKLLEQKIVHPGVHL